MLKAKRFAIAAIAAAAMTAGAVSAEAKSCVVKAASGTNTTADGAKFQAFEAILQATDWGTWAAWMANGTTPAYSVAKPSYTCKAGGLGYECIGKTTVCKL